MIFDALSLIIFLAGLILVVGIKFANDWAIETTALIEEEGQKTIDLIKGIREDLVKLNKVLKIIKDFKFSHVKNIVAKIFDLASIIVILYPGVNKRFKLTGFTGLKLAKNLVSLFKPVFD